MIKNLLFDFDGTIVDTSEGIIKSINYTFNKLGLDIINNNDIKKVIGPPLEEMFEILLSTKNKELIDNAIHYFRERYSKKGLYELKLYDGVEETLEYLYKVNINMFIVTSKPYEFTKTICQNLNIQKFFKDISGSNLNGELKSKGDRIGETISNYNLNIKETLMIGDRQEDAFAAKQNNINTIGMLYGFGTKIDLENSKCKYFCKTFNELKILLQSKS